MPQVTVGDGTAPGIEMGPLITRDALERVTGFVAGAEARVPASSSTAASSTPAGGFFIGPRSSTA
jgi:malonate-semialdehyde dehydrogenase (acetylating)/methylmalonate-semialdehyde dehydrogenase